MTNSIQIDFAKIEGPVYTGRPRGESLRKKYHLDDLDKSDTRIDVLIPDSTYSISSSFFLGLFGASVVRAGTREKFFEKFRFVAGPVFTETIESCVARALQEKGLFSGES